MLRCSQCEDMTFEEESEARQHIQDQHSDDVDNELMEYLGDAISTIYDQFINEEEGKDEQ